MGTSGSGKSTLLYNVSGMDRPDAGTIVLDGDGLTGLSEAEMSHQRLLRMGFVFQQPHFLKNLSIRDNVLLPALKANKAGTDEAHARADGLLARFGVGHLAGHGITEVSGGQLQRAAICRALATDPVILFADEPTGALNHAMTHEVLDAFTEAHRLGTTIVMVTHDPICAARTDRVLYLRDGRVVDALQQGRWHEDAASTRTKHVLAWLQEKDF